VLLKVLGLDDASYVDALRADEECELARVLNSLGERVDLEDGEAADQLLGFGEGAVDDPDLPLVTSTRAPAELGNTPSPLSRTPDIAASRMYSSMAACVSGDGMIPSSMSWVW
jgi:hypothetical protein